MRSFISQHLDKLGVGGSLFAALCCLGVPAMLSIVSAIGLGFLVNDKILQPLLIIFLLLAMGGLAVSLPQHRRPWPLVLGLASALATYYFIFGRFNKPLAYTSIAGLIAASVLNVVFQRRCAKVAGEVSK